MHFEEYLAPVARDPHGLDELRGTLGAADLAMVNLETAITQGGTPAPGKQFTFRAPATAFTALKAAGVDVASKYTLTVRTSTTDLRARQKS